MNTLILIAIVIAILAAAYLVSIARNQTNTLWKAKAEDLKKQGVKQINVEVKTIFGPAHYIGRFVTIWGWGIQIWNVDGLRFIPYKVITKLEKYPP